MGEKKLDRMVELLVRFFAFFLHGGFWGRGADGLGGERWEEERWEEEEGKEGGGRRLD